LGHSEVAAEQAGAGASAEARLSVGVDVQAELVASRGPQHRLHRLLA